MKIKIFNVEHGNCALIESPNNQHILIDCGHNNETNFYPSSYLEAKGIQNLHHLIISNLDQDHISDIEQIYEKFKPRVITRNKTIDKQFLYRVKDDITPQMQKYIEMHENYTTPVTLDYEGMSINFFSHDEKKFDDTNNLSLVTFLSYNGIKIIFPGDLEKEGWKELLLNKNFIEHLKDVNIFVASHHGRVSGYHPEIFNVCKPKIILISDEKIQYDTQRNVDYSKHSKGIDFGGVKRYVITTRNDGMITINANNNHGNTLNFENNTL